MKRYEHGGGLIEGLVSLTVLSVGLLGMAGMQGTLIQEQSESRTRMQAGFLASSVLGMAAANPENVGCFIVNSTQSVACASPDVQAQAASWTDQVNNALPGSAGVPPTVAYDATSGQLTVTLRWQMRGDTTVHNFIAATQVSSTL
jgi:type IV pilus assembly protein PilV